MLGLKDANSSNRAECIAYISKRAIQGLDITDLQALCEKAGLTDDIHETRKSELRYSLLEEAATKGIAILPCLDWEALEKEQEYAELQRQKIEEEKAKLSMEALNQKSRLHAREAEMQSASIKREEVRQQNARTRTSPFNQRATSTGQKECKRNGKACRRSI